MRSLLAPFIPFISLESKSLMSIARTLMDCMFSGKATENEEHIIPRWLQKRFKLQEQTYYLPNGTTIKYKKCKIPVRKEDNSKFGNIENNISEGRYDPMELYLWALKIHIGLIFKSSNLKSDIKNSSSSSILEIGNFYSEVNFFRMIYSTWRNGGVFEPSPLGSVFLHDPLVQDMGFDFIHCIATGTISVNLGPKFLTVFLWDKGAASRANFQEMWEKHHIPFVEKQNLQDKEKYAYFARRVWAFESAINTLRVRSAISSVSSDKMFSIIPSLNNPTPANFDESFYRRLSPSFGLEIVNFNGGVGIIYQPIDIK